MIRIDGNGLPEVFGGLFHFIFLEEKNAQPEVGQGIVGKVLDGKQEMLFGFFLLFAFGVIDAGKQVVSLGVGTVYLQERSVDASWQPRNFVPSKEYWPSCKGLLCVLGRFGGLEDSVFSLRKIGLVNKSSFLVGGDTTGKQLAQVVVSLSEFLIDVEGGLVVLAGFFEIIRIREQSCFAEVGRSVVLINFGYLVEIVLGFLGIIQLNEQKSVVKIRVCIIGVDFQRVEKMIAGCLEIFLGD